MDGAAARAAIDSKDQAVLRVARAGAIGHDARAGHAPDVASRARRSLRRARLAGPAERLLPAALPGDCGGDQPFDPSTSSGSSRATSRDAWLRARTGDASNVGGRST